MTGKLTPATPPPATTLRPIHPPPPLSDPPLLVFPTRLLLTPPLLPNQSLPVYTQRAFLCGQILYQPGRIGSINSIAGISARCHNSMLRPNNEASCAVPVDEVAGTHLVVCRSSWYCAVWYCVLLCCVVLEYAVAEFWLCVNDVLQKEPKKIKEPTGGKGGF